MKNRAVGQLKVSYTEKEDWITPAITGQHQEQIEKRKEKEARCLWHQSDNWVVLVQQAWDAVEVWSPQIWFSTKKFPVLWWQWNPDAAAVLNLYEEY